MKTTLTAFRHDVVGPRGGAKRVHAIERDGIVLFDNGSRRQAQSFFFLEETRLTKLGYDVVVKTRNWYGKD